MTDSNDDQSTRALPALDLDEVVAIIEAAGAEPDDRRAVLRVLRELGGLAGADVTVDQSPGHVVGAARWAFEYRVKHRVVDERRRVRFEPLHGSNYDGGYPPEVGAVDGGIVAAWEALAARVTVPFAVARLQHLLFERRVGNGRERAVSAAEAYLRCAATADGAAATDARSTAMALSRAVGDDDLHDRVVTLFLDECEASLTAGDRPGAAVASLEAVAQERGLPGRYDDLLATALVRGLGLHLRDRVQVLRRHRCADGGGRAAIDGERVDAWLAEAERVDGVIRSAHLTTALTIAENSGDAALTARAAAALQNHGNVLDDLAEISAWTAFDDEERERMLRPITSAPDFDTALNEVSMFGPITGPPNRNREQAEEHARTFVASELFPQLYLGPDGLPMYQAIDEDTKADIRLAEIEERNLQAYGPLVAEALMRIKDQHGVPTEAQLRDMLMLRPLMDDGFAGAIARSLHRYWMGDPEGAAFTAAPRVETAARKLLLATNAGVYRLQREQRPGQYPGLGVLLNGLLGRGVPEGWYRFVHVMATHPVGWNLRNNMSHGFLDDVGWVPAAVLLQAVLHLTMYGPKPSPDEVDGG